MTNILNASHQKILLREQGVLELEFAFSARRIRIRLIEKLGKITQFLRKNLKKGRIKF